MSAMAASDWLSSTPTKCHTIDTHRSLPHMYGQQESHAPMIVERVAIRRRSGYNAPVCIGTYDDVDTSDKTDS